MSGVLEMLRSRFSPRAAVLALVTISVAACSADTSRFSDNPFASLSNHEPTAGMPQAQTAQAPPPRSGTSTSVALNSGAASEATGSVLRKPTSSGNWSWDGGTAITVAAGESIDTIARRYGVPASVIMQANNIAAPEFAATDVLVPECGCGACAVCACGIPAVGPGLLREANGLSLNRDMSALQAATLIVTSASTAARGESRERNISRTPDIAPYSYATQAPS